MPNARQVFFMSAAVQGEIARRHGHQNHVAKRDMARWYGMLSDEARALKFDDREMAAIADATRGAAWTPTNYRLLWAVVDAGLRDIAARHQVHAAGIVARIRALTPGQTWALIDLLERQGGTS